MEEVPVLPSMRCMIGIAVTRRKAVTPWKPTTDSLFLHGWRRNGATCWWESLASSCIIIQNVLTMLTENVILSALHIWCCKFGVCINVIPRRQGGMRGSKKNTPLFKTRSHRLNQILTMSNRVRHEQTISYYFIYFVPIRFVVLMWLFSDVAISQMSIIVKVTREW